MKATLAVFRREVTARRDLLLLAAAVTLIAVLMPFVPGTGAYGASDVRSTTSQVLALLLGWSVAIGLGVSVFGRDISAGRVGFYFARPLGAGAIFVGKILAALFITLACEAVVIVPAIVEARAELAQINATGWWAIVCSFVLVPTLLLLVAHALSVMGRARSGWLFLDLAAFAAVAVATWLAIRPLVMMGAVRAVVAVSAVLAVAAVASLAFAGFSGLAVGRTDVRRTHGAMSVTLWVLLGVVVVGVSAYTVWLRSFGPSDMADVEIFSVAPNGAWIEVWGTAPWHLDVHRRILISSSGDRFIMLPMRPYGNPMELSYSADGGTAVVLDRVPGSGNLGSLKWVDLTAAVPELAETLILVPEGTAPQLSPDGSRVALLEGGTVSVHDLASGQLVTAVRLPPSSTYATVLFNEHDRLRLFARSEGGDDSTIQIAEIDLGTRAVEETGRIEGVHGSRWMALDSSGQWMILVVRSDPTSRPRRFVYDARDGSYIREIADHGFMCFLEDGRLVILSDQGSDGARLVVESADGLTRSEHTLGESDWEGLGGEALPGQVVVGRLQHLDQRTRGKRYELIDVDSGEIRLIADGLRRAFTGFQWVSGRGGTVFWYVNEPESNRIFIDRRGAVVRWDPDTGDLAHVVGGAE